MLIEILQRREVEARRRKIAAEARASLEAYRRGDLQPQSVEDAVRELHAALDDDE